MISNDIFLAWGSWWRSCSPPVHVAPGPPGSRARPSRWTSSRTRSLETAFGDYPTLLFDLFGGGGRVQLVEVQVRGSGLTGACFVVASPRGGGAPLEEAGERGVALVVSPYHGGDAEHGVPTVSSTWRLKGDLHRRREPVSPDPEHRDARPGRPTGSRRRISPLYRELTSFPGRGWGASSTPTRRISGVLTPVEPQKSPIESHTTPTQTSFSRPGCGAARPGLGQHNAIISIISISLKISLNHAPTTRPTLASISGMNLAIRPRSMPPSSPAGSPKRLRGVLEGDSKGLLPLHRPLEVPPSPPRDPSKTGFAGERVPEGSSKGTRGLIYDPEFHSKQASHPPFSGASR